MKKTTLLLGASLLALSASAQFRTDRLRQMPAPADQSIRHGAATPNIYESGAEASKTTAVAPRWYNHPEALGRANGVDPYQEDLNSLNITWPDSTVRFTETNGSPSNRGINWLSFGEVFSPVNTLYNAATSDNRGKLRITNTNAYTLDSIMIRGLYSRTRNNTDTLVVVVIAETAGAKFATFSYNSPEMMQNHGIDSFAALLYSNPWYQRFVTQVGYRSGSTGPFLEADTFKVVLNAATFADSLADGTHRIRLNVGRIPVVAGGRVSMTATFKPGVTWTSGDPVTNYNFFAFMSHEVPTPNDFVQYPVGDLNMSYVAFKDSTNAMINSTLSIYQPSITWTAPFVAEVHNVSWLASCATCVAVGVENVPSGLNIGEAFPNPARTTVTIPVTVKSAATVSVSMSNMLGQVVARQSINAAAGQTKNAVFATETLANGVYLYTVEAGGERVTNRIVVAH